MKDSFMFLRQKAKENIKNYVDEILPEEFEKVFLGLNVIVKEMWSTSQKADNAGNVREKKDFGFSIGKRVLFYEVYQVFVVHKS